jgi:hypothetical protein
MNRRAFLRGAAAVAVAIPLAPLIPEPFRPVTPARVAAVFGVPEAILGYGAKTDVVKLSAWLPVSVEWLEDIAFYGQPEGDE